MYFKVYRNCDTFRLRKVVIELVDKEGVLIDRRRCFAGLFFKLRVKFIQKRMLKLGEKMSELNTAPQI